MVWEYVFEPRHIRIWGHWIPNYAPQSNEAATSRYIMFSSVGNPAALSVDTETRKIALRYYKAIHFRCRLSPPDKLALPKARDLAPGSAWWWSRDPSLVSGSFAYVSGRIGDIVEIWLDNLNASNALLRPNSPRLDFSSPDCFQIIWRRDCGGHLFDRADTSVLCDAAPFHWHVLGSYPRSERILRIKCGQKQHAVGDVISRAGAFRCRLCGDRLGGSVEL